MSKAPSLGDVSGFSQKLRQLFELTSLFEKSFPVT